MLPTLLQLKGIALDLLFPQWCVGCGREGVILCRSCIQGMVRIEPPVCSLCGNPQPDGMRCSVCTSQDTSVDAITALFRFEGVLRTAIHQFKYNNLRLAARPFAELLYEGLEEVSVPVNLLVPVPLHPKRLRARGYNQSALLACNLGKLSGLPVNDSLLIRTKTALPQAKTSSVGERRSNVADAFTCVTQCPTDAHILLVDDVCTSGATLDACAAALKAAGAASVQALVLAREL